MSGANLSLGGEHATANKATAWDNRDFIWQMRSQGRSADAIARMLGISAVDVARVPLVPPADQPSVKPQPVNFAPPNPYAGQWVLSLYKGLIRVPKTRTRKAAIAAEVAQKHDLTVDVLLFGRERSRTYAWPRQELMWRLREAGYSYPQIGMFVGGRDHSTVIFGVKAHAKRLAEGVIAE